MITNFARVWADVRVHTAYSLYVYMSIILNCDIGLGEVAKGNVNVMDVVWQKGVHEIYIVAAPR